MLTLAGGAKEMGNRWRCRGGKSGIPIGRRGLGSTREEDLSLGSRE